MSIFRVTWGHELLIKQFPTSIILFLIYFFATKQSIFKKPFEEKKHANATKTEFQ